MAAQKRMSAGQIINALRKAEVGIANGKRIKEVCRELGVSEQTYYRWRREYVCSVMPSSRLISFTDLPRARPTSASRSAVMICSGVCRFLPILTSSLKSFRPGRS